MCIAHKICTHTRSHNNSQELTNNLILKPNKNKSLEIKEDNCSFHQTCRSRRNSRMKIINPAHIITQDMISQELTYNLLPIYDKNKSLKLKEKYHTFHKTYKIRRNSQMKITNLAHTRIHIQNLTRTHNQFTTKIRQ